MKNILLLTSLLFFTLTSCTKENIITGAWKGKNNDGVGLLWTFSPDGKASSTKGNSPIQEMKYSTDKSKTPWHINLNSLVDDGTLRAIYKFTASGKLVIGINQDVTIRPKSFTTPGLQLLILTKK